MSVAQRHLDERTGELINAVETQGEANSDLRQSDLRRSERAHSELAIRR